MPVCCCMPIFVISPIIGWTWPALLPIAAAAAGAMGYKTYSGPARKTKLTRKLENLRREVVPLERELAEVVSDEVGNEERLNLERDGIVLVFRKDAQGKFFIEVVADKRKMSREQMRHLGQEFARELIKKFAYHKIAEQLERAGVEVVAEEVQDDGRIRLNARRWR